ncbi:DUF6088 family protein [Geopseudomonas aromaticivorans]|uniref:DUF6088 family protein n=1 Tax=Geopseudomonas aromaticivorans TaxID=2849492 RepID=UPI0020C8D2C3|nr:DUF6088 family protein [Pseudomonas aromaticivorans]
MVEVKTERFAPPAEGASATDLAFRRIQRLPRGRLFSRALLADLGSPAAISRALSRLCARGDLERIVRGVYMRPKLNRYIGQVRPSVQQVVRLIARRNNETVQMHGAEAVRQLGLSTQMPMVPMFYTSGHSRTVRVGAAVAHLRHVAPDKLQCAGSPAGIALVALHYIGRRGADDRVLSHLKAFLTTTSDDDLAMLYSCKMPLWMRSFVQSGIHQD